METQTIALLISSVSAFGSAIAAIAAWRALHASRRSTEGQLVVTLRDQFSSSQMHDDMRLLRAHKDKFNSKFSSKFISLKDKDPIQFKNINDARRRIKGYFVKVMLIHKNNILETELILAITSINQTTK